MLANWRNSGGPNKGGVGCQSPGCAPSDIRRQHAVDAVGRAPREGRVRDRPAPVEPPKQRSAGLGGIVRDLGPTSLQAAGRRAVFAQASAPPAPCRQRIGQTRTTVALAADVPTLFV